MGLGFGGVPSGITPLQLVIALFPGLGYFNSVHPGCLEGPNC